MSGMDNFRDVINAWPSTAELAEDIDEKVATVFKWRERDRIPSGKWVVLLAAAKKRHIKLDEKLLTMFSYMRSKRAA